MKRKAVCILLLMLSGAGFLPIPASAFVAPPRCLPERLGWAGYVLQCRVLSVTEDSCGNPEDPYDPERRLCKMLNCLVTRELHGDWKRDTIEVHYSKSAIAPGQYFITIMPYGVETIYDRYSLWGKYPLPYSELYLFTSDTEAEKVTQLLADFYVNDTIKDKEEHNKKWWDWYLRYLSLEYFTEDAMHCAWGYGFCKEIYSFYEEVKRDTQAVREIRYNQRMRRRPFIITLTDSQAMAFTELIGSGRFDAEMCIALNDLICYKADKALLKKSLMKVLADTKETDDTIELMERIYWTDERAELRAYIDKAAILNREIVKQFGEGEDEYEIIKPDLSYSEFDKVKQQFIHSAGG